MEQLTERSGVSLRDRATRASPRAAPRLGHSASIANALTAWMRNEGIRDVHHDRVLDRFSVTLADYTLGLGGSVKDALTDARGRA